LFVLHKVVQRALSCTDSKEGEMLWHPSHIDLSSSIKLPVVQVRLQHYCIGENDSPLWKDFMILGPPTIPCSFMSSEAKSCLICLS
jgi:hypothetical protein